MFYYYKWLDILIKLIESELYYLKWPYDLLYIWKVIGKVMTVALDFIQILGKDIAPTADLKGQKIQKIHVSYF